MARKVLSVCYEECLPPTTLRFLERAGCEMTCARTLGSALQFFDTAKFDLILINEYLPDAECEDVLKALQRKGEQTPCIVMQPSTPEVVDFTRFEALGAKDIVCKHCSRQIVEMVRECLVCDGTWLPAA